MLTAAVRTGLMLLCGALLFYCVILGVGFASTAALLALSRAALLIELPFLCLLMDCAMTAAQSTLTEALYEVTRQSDAAQPTISGELPTLPREQTVLAGMMAWRRTGHLRRSSGVSAVPANAAAAKRAGSFLTR